jgi:hypothetical protein
VIFCQSFLFHLHWGIDFTLYSFLRPGTIHSVYSLEDSVSIGGFLFLPTLFDQTLLSMIQYHLHGQRLTNEDYPGSHISCCGVLSQSFE